MVVDNNASIICIETLLKFSILKRPSILFNARNNVNYKRNILFKFRENFRRWYEYWYIRVSIQIVEIVSHSASMGSIYRVSYQEITRVVNDGFNKLEDGNASLFYIDKHRK